jgi:hypothetical protein
MPSRWLPRVELHLRSGQEPRSSGWGGDLDNEIGALLVLPAAKNGSLR